GEMVDLLWRAGRRSAALRVEQLWNALERDYTFMLLCAYEMSSFRSETDSAELEDLCALHTEARPTEQFPLSGDESARQRAITLLQQRTLALESEKRLRQSELRMRLLIDNVRDYAIFMLDPAGHVTTWNPGAQRIKGYEANEIVGRHFSTFYPADDIAAGKC